MNAIELLLHESSTLLAVYPELKDTRWAEALAAAKKEAERSPTWLGHCSGCTDPHSEGTHQMGTIEHPEIDNAKEEQGKVLTDEAIDDLCDRYTDVVRSAYPDLWAEMSAGFETGLRTARDNGYLAPASGLTVDEVMEVVTCWDIDASEEANVEPATEHGLECLRKALEDLAGKGSDPWISVEDRVPERFDTVLTFGELGVIVCRYADGIWRHWESDRENKHEVTHWMPLPAPPDNTAP